MTVVVTSGKRLANMENDPSITSAEWKLYASLVYGELYEEVARTGLRYFEYEETYTTTTDGYLDEMEDQLAVADCLELVLDASGRTRRLQPLRIQERSRYAGRTGTPERFAFVDDRLYLYPTPAAGTEIILRYIAQSPDLSEYSDGQSIDVVCEAGESFLYWGMAAMGRAKDDRFVDHARDQQRDAKLRLVDWAANRLANESNRPYVDDEADEFTRRPGDW
jgi:hypothetical protein